MTVVSKPGVSQLKPPLHTSSIWRPLLDGPFHCHHFRNSICIQCEIINGENSTKILCFKNEIVKLRSKFTPEHPMYAYRLLSPCSHACPRIDTIKHPVGAFPVLQFGRNELHNHLSRMHSTRSNTQCGCCITREQCSIPLMVNKGTGKKKVHKRSSTLQCTDGFRSLEQCIHDSLWNCFNTGCSFSFQIRPIRNVQLVTKPSYPQRGANRETPVKSSSRG